jgi:DivIVA domain-containing protein
MGLHEVAGWLSIACGAVGAGGALYRLTTARQSGAGFRAIPLDVCAWLLTSLGVLTGGILYVCDSRYPHGSRLAWIPIAFVTAGMAPLIGGGIVWSRRVIRDSSSSAETPGPDPSSANTAGADPAITIDASTADLIERIKNVRFGTTRLAQGYDEEEVDVFLDNLMAVLSGGGRLHGSELREVQFSRTRLRPGYVIADVVAFLDEVTPAG